MLNVRILLNSYFHFFSHCTFAIGCYHTLFIMHLSFLFLLFRKTKKQTRKRDIEFSIEGFLYYNIGDQVYSEMRNF